MNKNWPTSGAQTMTTGWRWALLVLLAALVTLPLAAVIGHGDGWINNSTLFSMTQMLMLVTLASNWNLVSGILGYVDFGHAAFFGLGAYATGILMTTADWPFFPTLGVGAITAALTALIIGRATMHLKGPYFSIAMLGTFAALREIVRVSRPLTGGGPGLSLPPYLNRPLFYYLALAQAVLVVGLYRRLKGTEFAAMMLAIRENERGAEMRGINTMLIKLTVFTFAAASTGLVGGMWAYQSTFIDPDVVFLDSRTIEMALASVLGGLGTIVGPVVGSALLYWMRDIVWASFLRWHLIIEGTILISVVLAMPRGMVGLLGNRPGLNLLRLRANLRRFWAHKDTT